MTPDDADPPEPRKPEHKPHHKQPGTGEWVKQQATTALDLLVSRERDADKRDARALYLVAAFGILGWLGFLVLGGHEIATRIDAQSGKVEFRANGATEGEP